MRLFWACLGLLLTGGVSANAQEFWEKKDYRQWNEFEVRKLLENSPWAKKYTVSTVRIDPLGQATGDRAREPNPRLEYQVQLRAALPIRQALVRQAQLQTRYDQMEPIEQKNVDQQAEQFLRREFPDTIIVHVAYGSNVTSFDREMTAYWQQQTTDLLRNTVFLISPRGERFELLEYRVVPSDRKEFQFTFPRKRQGQPLVQPGDKTLMIEFQHPDIGGQGAARVFLEFRLDRMQLGGRVSY